MKGEFDEITGVIYDHLRAVMFSDPKSEKEVQDKIETIFRVRGLDYRREQQGIPYSSKHYVPDFTFDALRIAVEVKLCNRTGREKEIIDEINADIIGYQGSYDRTLFVIYDLGFIRDVARLKSTIERQVGVRVMIIKK